VSWGCVFIGPSRAVGSARRFGVNSLLVGSFTTSYSNRYFANCEVGKKVPDRKKGAGQRKCGPGTVGR
jgi:hypothetical protein